MESEESSERRVACTLGGFQGVVKNRAEGAGGCVGAGAHLEIKFNSV